MTTDDVERGYGLTTAGFDGPMTAAAGLERGYDSTGAADAGGPMTAAAGLELERRYRRWLRWYPPSFRSEYEAEMLEVLLASAHQGQRRPEPMECLALLRGALCLRLRPYAPGSDRSVVTAVTFMYLGAVVELAAAVTIAATIGDVRSNVMRSNPGLTADQWHAVVAGQLEPTALAAVLAVGFWLWMAWAIGHGQRRARIAFALFFALNTWGLGNGLTGGGAAYAHPDLAIGSVVWLAELVAVVLLFRLKTAVVPPGVRRVTSEG